MSDIGNEIGKTILVAAIVIIVVAVALFALGCYLLL